MDPVACNPEIAPALPGFLADAMLGRLATWLRLLGYDAAYRRNVEPEPVERCRRESRILLTRNTRLLSRRDLPRHLRIESDRVQEQLHQVIRAFGLEPTASRRWRCARCNVPVLPQGRAEMVGQVPEFVWSRHEAFWACPVCQRIYWAGSHQRRVAEAVRSLLETERTIP